MAMIETKEGQPGSRAEGRDRVNARPVVLAAVVMLGVLAASMGAQAQRAAGKVYQIGVLGTSGPWTSLERGLQELGWIGGKNIAFEYRYTQGDLSLYPVYAEELVKLKVDVIVTNSPGVRAAKQATTSIPIVMANSGDPLGEGIVASLARPGGNITGLTYNVGREAAGKNLHLLKEAVPKASTLGFLFNPSVKAWREEFDAAAKVLGVALRYVEVRNPNELEAAFAGMTKARVDALLVSGGSFEFANRRQIIELAARHRIPTLYTWRAAAVDGGLMTYGASLDALSYRAATYVDKILKGAKPGDLPVEQPTTFDFVVNLKTAKALGLTVPPSLLVRADQIIE